MREIGALALMAFGACSFAPGRFPGTDDGGAMSDAIDVAEDAASRIGVTVQSGTSTLDANAAMTSVALAPVDPARSLLVFSLRVDSASPSGALVGGELDATTLVFRRVGDASEVTIRWYVATFASGLTVQRGVTSLTSATTATPTIAAVDLSRAFPLISMAKAGSNIDGDDFVRARLSGPTTLELARHDLTNDRADVYWQVIEYSDATVQSGTVAFAAGDAIRPVQLVSPASEAWLVYTYTAQNGTGTDVGQKLVRGRQTLPDQLSFDRDNTGPTVDLAWYLVELGGDATVQHGNQSFTATEVTRDATLAAVDLARTVVMAGSVHHSGGKSPFAIDDNIGVATTTLDLVAPTTLRLTRAITGNQPADVAWFAIQF